MRLPSKRSSSVLKSLVMGTLVVSCGGSTDAGTSAPTAPDTTVATVTVSAARPAIYIGQSLTLTVVARNAAGSVVSMEGATWSSSDPGVATIATGVVTGIKAGTATITAAIAGKSGSVALAVAQVPVSTVILTPANAALDLGQTVQLVATPKDSAGGTLAGRAITFATSAASIGLVSTTGLVTAVAAGNATITASAEGKSTSITLKVAAGTPSAPSVTAPARLKVGTIGTASVAAQAGLTYAWSITGGDIVSGAGAAQLTFRPTSAGPVTLSATASRNGIASTPGEATTISFATLTRILNGDVGGSPAAGATDYDTPGPVPYAYTPASGAGSVIAEIDGVRAAGTGQITMDRDHEVYAYGQAASGTTFSDMIVVPNDPQKIPSVGFYAARAVGSVTLADPYCATTMPSIAFPKSYLGAYPLPAPAASLPASTERGVALKDYWAVSINNPSTNSGCRGDWHAAVMEAMRRAKQIGSDYVAIFQNAYLDDVTASTLKFNCMSGEAACPSWAQVPDAEILWAANAARGMGLKLYIHMQVDVVDIRNQPLPTAPSSDFLTRYFAAYKDYAVHIGQLAQQGGASVLQVDWSVWWIDWTKPEYQPIYRQRLTEVSAAVRQVFSGKRALGTLSIWSSANDALMSEVDLLLLDLWPVQFKLTAADLANLSPGVVKQRTEEVIRDFANVVGRYNKPAIFRIMAQSHRDYLKSGWIEDGFCTSGCMQRSVITDFSVQAIAYEGELEAIKGQSSFPVGAVEAVGYWFADVLLPKESFPNLSQSIRNKPAEYLLSRWFAR